MWQGKQVFQVLALILLGFFVSHLFEIKRQRQEQKAKSTDSESGQINRQVEQTETVDNAIKIALNKLG